MEHTQLTNDQVDAVIERIKNNPNYSEEKKSKMTEYAECMRENDPDPDQDRTIENIERWSKGLAPITSKSKKKEETSYRDKTPEEIKKSIEAWSKSQQ